MEVYAVIGANHKGCVVTLVGRMLNFSLFTPVSDKTKEAVTKAVENSLRSLKKKTY